MGERNKLFIIEIKSNARCHSPQQWFRTLFRPHKWNGMHFNSLSSTITQAQALNGPSDLDNAPFYFPLTLPLHRLNTYIYRFSPSCRSPLIRNFFSIKCVLHLLNHNFRCGTKKILCDRNCISGRKIMGL